MILSPVVFKNNIAVYNISDKNMTLLLAIIRCFLLCWQIFGG